MRKTVLIVDDNVFVRHALYEFFTREPDFEVCGLAENGREAIEEACRLHPDVIILDLSMPVMNGLEAARVLKHAMPGIVVIIYSALGAKLPEQQARLLGISEMVSKSDDVSVLIGTARSLLYQRAA